MDGRFDGSKASGLLSRSRGTVFGVNCRATGVTWTAEPGSPPPMPPPTTEGGIGSGNPPLSSPEPSPNSGPASGTYSGTTSQGLPITFAVSSGYVSMVRFGWRARCEDGQVHSNTILLPGGPTENGSFRTGGTPETGGIAHVSGQLDGETASGILSRSRGTAFGVNCRATGIRWRAIRS